MILHGSSYGQSEQITKNDCQKQNGRQKQNACQKKTDHNSLNFQARSSRFCMVVHIDLLQITDFAKEMAANLFVQSSKFGQILLS